MWTARTATRRRCGCFASKAGNLDHDSPLTQNTSSSGPMTSLREAQPCSASHSSQILSERGQSIVSKTNGTLMMTKTNNVNLTDSTWTGMVPVDDTALAVSDTGGTGIPVVYLNGAYADQSHWRRVIADLGPGWRHITYDERARGRSKRSADYSFEATVRDL